MTDRLRRVAVYCGASLGCDEHYQQLAHALGEALAKRGLGLVYGGGRVGLMGVLADAVLAGGGQVIGVITESLLRREVGHSGVSELRVVASMHQRKACMADMADAFVALPGGFGTMDELFEVITWAQLGLHDKPIALLDANGYFDHLRRFIEHAAHEGFIRQTHVSKLQCFANVEALLNGVICHFGDDAEAHQDWR